MTQPHLPHPDLLDLPRNAIAPTKAQSDCPTSFPPPRFHWGDRLRWLPLFPGDTPDCGTAIGLFYTRAPHHRTWTWCYLILLDPHSPSARFCQADIAWEDDLEPDDSAPTASP